MLTTSTATARRKNNIFGAFKGQIIELVPDPFNTGYDEMKARKENELKGRGENWK